MNTISINIPPNTKYIDKILKLDSKQLQKVLEIGSGSGWQSAILANIVGKGKIYTIERHNLHYLHYLKYIVCTAYTVEINYLHYLQY